MADDRRGYDEEREEEEGKIVVHDRRRVTMDGEIRHVEEEAPKPAAPEPAPQPEPKPEPTSAAPDRGGRTMSTPPRRGATPTPEPTSRPQLREVPPEPEDQAPAPDEEAEEAGEEDGARKPKDVTEVVIQMTQQMMIWSFVGLGIAENPITGLVATDIDKARFAVETEISLLSVLMGQIEPERVEAMRCNLALNYASVAAQLMRQETQAQLANLQEMRFCIDTADTLIKPVVETGAQSQHAQQVVQVIAAVKLQFVQLTGGGGVIG